MKATNRQALRWGSRRLESCAAVLIYIAVAIYATWPLIQFPTSAVPTGETQAVTVPLFNAWTIWWNADRALHGFQGYWDAPIFHPAKDTFAFSEPQLTTLLVAPILWISGSRILAYNVYLWLALVLNGVFAERLLRVLKVRSWAAIGGGAAMVMLPIVHWQLDVVQLAPIWTILWTWTACWQMVRLRDSPLWSAPAKKGLEAGIALSITFHSCGHHGLFLGLILGGTAWILPSRWLSKRLWLSVTTAFIAVAILVGPFALKMTGTLKTNNFVRSETLIASLSAMPQDYLGAPGIELINLGDNWCRPYWRLAPGWVKMSLSLIAIAWGVSRRRTRRWTLFMTATMSFAFILSLGLNLKFCGWQPYAWLNQLIPGLSQVRNVFRFAFFVQITATILTAQLSWWLWLFIRVRRRNHTRSYRFACAILAALVFASVLEVRPYQLRIGLTPDAAAHQAWIGFLKQHTTTSSAVLCLPFPKGYQVRDFEGTTRWMYYGTYHGMPLVNGYSGFFPSEFFALHESLNKPQVDPAVWSQLSGNNVGLIVVERESGTEIQSQLTSPQFELAFSDPIGVDVYFVRRP